MEAIIFHPAEYQDLKEMFTKSQEIIQEQAKLLTNAKVAWVDVEQASEITGYSPKTLKVRKSEIGYRTMGRELFFKLSDLDKWMDKYYRGPKPRK